MSKVRKGGCVYVPISDTRFYFFRSDPRSFQLKTKKHNLRTRRLATPWPIDRYEPFGIVGEAGTCHFNFRFSQGNAPSPLYCFVPKEPQTQSISSSVSPVAARSSPHLHLSASSGSCASLSNHSTHPTRPVHSLRLSMCSK